MPVKIVLKIDYNDESEKSVVKRMLKADDAFHALSMIDDSMRDILKYWEPERFTRQNILNLAEDIQESIRETGIHDIYN